MKQKLFNITSGHPDNKNDHIDIKIGHIDINSGH